MQNAPKYKLLEAKAKIEWYCAYQERCDFEVRKKLHDWNMPYDQVDILISDLISNNFLNEERFACAFVSGKFRIKRWGRIKIKQHLKQKRISDYSINKGMQEIDEDEYIQTIQDLIASKSRLTKFKDKWDRKVKLTRYLASKGFESYLIAEELSDE
ncbi:MAG: regulatory protein RecX [Crocinitomicaceae bacterium]